MWATPVTCSCCITELNTHYELKFFIQTDDVPLAESLHEESSNPIGTEQRIHMWYRVREFHLDNEDNGSSWNIEAVDLRKRKVHPTGWCCIVWQTRQTSHRNFHLFHKRRVIYRNYCIKLIFGHKEEEPLWTEINPKSNHSNGIALMCPVHESY